MSMVNNQDIVCLGKSSDVLHFQRRIVVNVPTVIGNIMDNVIADIIHNIIE